MTAGLAPSGDKTREIRSGSSNGTGASGRPGGQAGQASGQPTAHMGKPVVVFAQRSADTGAGGEGRGPQGGSSGAPSQGGQASPAFQTQVFPGNASNAAAGSGHPSYGFAKKVDTPIRVASCLVLVVAVVVGINVPNILQRFDRSESSGLVSTSQDDSDDLLSAILGLGSGSQSAGSASSASSSLGKSSSSSGKGNASPTISSSSSRNSSAQQAGPSSVSGESSSSESSNGGASTVSSSSSGASQGGTGSSGASSVVSSGAASGASSQSGSTQSAQLQSSSSSSTQASSSGGAGSVDTVDGTFSYSCYWDGKVSVATIDGGWRTLGHFYLTNLSHAPSSADEGLYAEGFILTTGNHCIHWAGQVTGGSIDISFFWYSEGGVDYRVSATSYDIDGFHWFGFDPVDGNFRIS